MHLQSRLRSTSLLPWLDIFAYSYPGGGKTAFGLSAYYEREGARGGPVFFDFDMRGVDATAADLGLSGKIPVFSLKTEEEMIYSCSYPQEIVKTVNADPKFKDYKVEVFVYDTVSSMEDSIMGEGARPQGDLLPASSGFGLMKKQRTRDGIFEPALGDYKALHNRTLAFLRRVREMEMHTIVTCHAGRFETHDSPRGLSVPPELKKFGTFPGINGQNKYTVAKLHDFFLFMEAKGGKFLTYTQSQSDFQARTRLRSKLKPVLENLTFWDLLKVYDEARAAESITTNQGE